MFSFSKLDASTYSLKSLSDKTLIFFFFQLKITFIVTLCRTFLSTDHHSRRHLYHAAERQWGSNRQQAYSRLLDGLPLSDLINNNRAHRKERFYCLLLASVKFICVLLINIEAFPQGWSTVTLPQSPSLQIVGIYSSCWLTVPVGQKCTGFLATICTITMPTLLL